MCVRFQPTQGEMGSGGDAHETLLLPSCLSFTFPFFLDLLLSFWAFSFVGVCRSGCLFTFYTPLTEALYCCAFKWK